MKTAIVLLALSAQTVLAADYAFECSCNSSRKICDGLENLTVISTSEGVRVEFSNYDGEFNSAAETKPSTLAVPTKYAKEGLIRHEMVFASYNPDIYAKGSILFPAKAAKKGKAYMLNRKSNKVELGFKCVESDPELF